MKFQRNALNQGDGMEMLRSLPDGCAAAVFYDPQYRGVVERIGEDMHYRNRLEGSAGRCPRWMRTT